MSSQKTRGGIEQWVVPKSMLLEVDSKRGILNASFALLVNCQEKDIRFS